MRVNVQQANFDDLLQTYFFATPANEAARSISDLIRRHDDAVLRRLLRDYRPPEGSAVTDPREIKWRAAADRLMNCYAILEIASLAGFIGDPRETAFTQSSREILENSFVRRYYEEFYPLNLPRLYRRRLASDRASLPPAEPAPAEMIAFLDLDRRFMKELEDGVFLKMLDSFWFSGIGFPHVIAAIGDPVQFIDHILRDPEKRDFISTALSQFSTFMAFCFDLDRLLARLEDRPLLQSAMWNHYGYWFDIIGESLHQNLGKALSQFLHWQPPPAKADAAEAIQAYVTDARAVLMRLTSAGYSEPVKRFLEQPPG